MLKAYKHFFQQSVETGNSTASEISELDEDTRIVSFLNPQALYVVKNE